MFGAPAGPGCGAGPLCVPVGGGPPASRPRCVFWPFCCVLLQTSSIGGVFRVDFCPVVTNVVNPMAFWLKIVVFWLRLTTFVTEVLTRRLKSRCFDDVCNVGRPLVARPGPVATAQVSRPDLTCRIAETAPNFARNSPATVSNTEFRSLELQRCQTFLKLRSIELRARFRGSVSLLAQQFRMQFPRMCFMV